MPTYTTIPDSTIAPEAPVTSELMTLLRDNPIATTEGDTGAPRVKGRALDVVNAETSDATLTATNLANIDYVLITGSLKLAHDSGGTAFQNAAARFRLSTDGGSSWGSRTEIAYITVTANHTQRVGISYVVDVSGSTDAIEIDATNGEYNFTLLNIGGS